MDKRSVLALFLIFAVIVGGSLLRPRQTPAPADTATVDSLARRDSLASTTAPAATGRRDSAAPATTTPAPASVVSPAPVSTITSATADLRPETTTVATNDRQLHIVSPGAALPSVTLPEYQELKRKEGPVVVHATHGPLLRYRIVNGQDTILLDRIAFERAAAGADNAATLTSKERGVTITYAMDSANYLTHVRVSMAGAAPDARLLIDLASDLNSGEADEAEDVRNLAYSYRPARNDVESMHLMKLDSLNTTAVSGPLEWVAVRNKYFLLAVMNPDSTRPFTSLTMRGRSHQQNERPTGTATATLPLVNGQASFDLYTGPQSWRVLRAVGHELSNVNPYGWSWIRPLVEPFATIVMRMLLGMKGLVGLSYGWVLVIFGVLIRLVLWPLQQSAMRTSIKMQALQPELQALQKRYAKDPEGQRTAMMKLYQDHGMSPLSPLLGCLPMLLPMPILMALYFVFQNTIEFRGVPFLWLPDISMKDPFYITPLVMGASMLVMSLIGMRAGPPNPQAKVMGYMMPAMFTIMFLNFASGLNLYYAVQNLVGIPQQWLLIREREKASKTPVVKGPPATKQRK